VRTLAPYPLPPSPPLEPPPLRPAIRIILAPLPPPLLLLESLLPRELPAQQRELPQSPPSPLVTVRRPRISPLARPSHVLASARPIVALTSLWISQRNRNLHRRPGDSSDSGSVLLLRQLPLLLPLSRVVLIGTVRQCHNQVRPHDLRRKLRRSRHPLQPTDESLASMPRSRKEIDLQQHNPHPLVDTRSVR
jgi:hypothetical protein